MAKLKIYNDIVDEEQKLCMAEWERRKAYALRT